jgi:hypothetical protein
LSDSKAVDDLLCSSIAKASVIGIQAHHPILLKLRPVQQKPKQYTDSLSSYGASQSLRKPWLGSFATGKSSQTKESKQEKGMERRA